MSEDQRDSEWEALLEEDNPEAWVIYWQAKRYEYPEDKQAEAEVFQVLNRHKFVLEKELRRVIGDLCGVDRGKHIRFEVRPPPEGKKRRYQTP